MLDDFLIDKLQNEALDYLAGHLDARYTYHSAEHTLEVCNAVKLFAGNSSFSAETLFALRLAAIFHDFGYLIQSFANEGLAEKYIFDFGRRCRIDEKYLTAAHELILETVYPYQPSTPAGKLLCDADIEYIGRDEFMEKALLFRRELAAEGTVYTDGQWWHLELKFLEDNTFFTDACQRLRTAGRLRNLEKVRRLLPIES